MRGFDEILKVQKEQNEKFNKSVPAMVFFNHFDAATIFIENYSTSKELGKLDFYNNLSIRNDTFNIDRSKKLFWNSWSTENAFHLGIGDSEFYKFALHWHFPQAYYAIYLSMMAFHETQRIVSENHEKSINLFGHSVKHGHYPKAISYYANGAYKDFSYHGLNCHDNKDFNSASRINNLKEAEMQITSFLKSTREQNAENKRNRAIRDHSKSKAFQNKEGKLIKRFTKKHWDLIYNQMPETTLLNFIYRLRIKANYQDIETFIDADLDFKVFHEKIGIVVSYINFVHEAYFSKAVGIESYEKIFNSFNGHVFDDKAKRRLDIIRQLQCI